MTDDARRYWEARLAHRSDLRAVGHTSHHVGYTRWAYRVKRRVLLRQLRGLVAEDSRVLDTGTGLGFGIDLWKEAGASQVVASDFTDTSVRLLRQNYPETEIVQFDLTGPSVPFGPGEFDAVSAFEVLFHIVDDEAFATALRNLAAVVRLGGWLVFTDTFPHASGHELSHQVHRPFDTVCSSLQAAGWRVHRRRPLYVLMDEPVDAPHWWFRIWRNSIGRLAAIGRVGWLAGAVLAPLEVTLTALLAEGPSVEVMLCQRIQSDPA